MIKNITPVVLVKDDAYWLPYCLESVAGWFDHMVIYDVGSTDGTIDIINWYIDKEAHRTEFTVRLLPFVSPAVQGTFRNAMIAEARNDCYMILDADELYNEESIEGIAQLDSGTFFLTEEKPYGVFNRIEITTDLKSRYKKERTHHRLYHRSATWKGPHPGEAPVIPQTNKTEIYMKYIKCLHMHNTIRSPKDKDVPKRMQRRSQHTYHPGEIVEWDLLKEYPILRKPIHNFPVSPILKELQDV